MRRECPAETVDEALDMALFDAKEAQTRARSGDNPPIGPINSVIAHLQWIRRRRSESEEGKEVSPRLARAIQPYLDGPETMVYEGEDDGENSDGDRELRQIVALIQTMLDSNPGTRYECGHYTAEVRLVGDAIPAIAIWGHTALEPIAPRLMDMHTAKRFRSLAMGELGSVPTRTEEVNGSRADWRVILVDEVDQEDEPEVRTDGGEDHTLEDYQAAAAARDADDVPTVALEGTPVGECYDCGSRFPYGTPELSQGNLDPCPDCGSQGWGKWGYRHDGEEIPQSEVGDGVMTDGGEVVEGGEIKRHSPPASDSKDSALTYVAIDLLECGFDADAQRALLEPVEEEIRGWADDTLRDGMAEAFRRGSREGADYAIETLIGKLSFEGVPEPHRDAIEEQVTDRLREKKPQLAEVYDDLRHDALRRAETLPEDQIVNWGAVV